MFNVICFALLWGAKSGIKDLDQVSQNRFPWRYFLAYSRTWLSKWYHMIMNSMQDIVFEKKTDVVVGHLILQQVKWHRKMKRWMTKKQTKKYSITQVICICINMLHWPFMAEIIVGSRGAKSLVPWTVDRIKVVLGNSLSAKRRAIPDGFDAALTKM